MCLASGTIGCQRRDIPDWPTRADVLKPHDLIEALRGEAGVIIAELAELNVDPDLFKLNGGSPDPPAGAPSLRSTHD